MYMEDWYLDCSGVVKYSEDVSCVCSGLRSIRRTGTGFVVECREYGRL